DNFFDLGGHSFSAIRATAHTITATGIHIPATTMFQHPTIHTLAQWIDSNQPTDRAIALIQSGGPLPPLFLVHPVGGNVLCYRELAQRIAPDRPVYGLVARGVDTDAVPRESIEEMARAYLREVTAVTGDDSFCLGGWSMGGLVAYEMAQQEHRRTGRQVPVFMIDSFAPSAAGLGEYDDAQTMVDFAGDWAASSGLELDLKPADVAGLPRQDVVRMVLQRAGLPDTRDADEAALLDRLLRVYIANTRAIRGYHPQQAYPGPMFLYAARDNGFDCGDAAHGLGSWTSGRLDITPVPGDHYSILRGDNLSVLAAGLRSALESILESVLESGPESGEFK
ncbi:MAG TPA: alpha/beta fold hydrolase, partial [Candidatus Limnocylindrales bacterium]|nr:alpha/beta fold hydrolase [Candidatus Limnocylindrales bacterium]